MLPGLALRPEHAEGFLLEQVDQHEVQEDHLEVRGDAGEAHREAPPVKWSHSEGMEAIAGEPMGPVN